MIALRQIKQRYQRSYARTHGFRNTGDFQPHSFQHSSIETEWPWHGGKWKAFREMEAYANISLH